MRNRAACECWQRAFVGLAGFLVCTAVMALPATAFAQLDTKHWFPTSWSASAATNFNVGYHYIVISTPEQSPVPFTVKDAAGNLLLSSTVSNSAPVIHSLGYGEGATNLVCETNDLNKVNKEGLVIEAEQPVYATIRHRQNDQGTVATGKGRKALGREFRVGVPISYDKNQYYRGLFISVMATEDDTHVTFDDIKPGFVFWGTGTSGSPATSNDINVTLQANETYIIGVWDPQYNAAANLNDMNGTRVASDRPVAVISGSWLQGYNNGGQDIGIDQLVPVDSAGSTYVLIKGNAPANNQIEQGIVVAVHPDTYVYLNGSATPYNAAPLGPGDYLHIFNKYSAAGNLLVESSKPILMFQNIGGSSSTATPGFIFLPPLGADAATFIDNIPKVQLVGTARLGIVARKGAEVLLNGSPIGLSPSLVTGTNEWVTYKTGNITGHYSVTSNGAVAVALYNVSNNIGAAGFFSGFASGAVDLDEDGIPDGDDNCPDVANPDQTDTDNDGAGDACDGCPDNPMKVTPGLCGCGIPDGDPDGDGVGCDDNCPYTYNPNQADSDGDGVGDMCEDDADGDGVPDPLDGCPNDPNKILPGICGCGLSDIDSDWDGVPNCLDDCAADPNKTEPGQCGCGNPDEDTDGDGTADCIDGCPNDSGKIAEGTCGCGVPDTDTDEDGTADCIDACPADAAKTEPGICGCGTPDGLDECAGGLDNCDTNALCTDTTCGFTCECVAGYAGDGVTCVDIDECANGTHSCGLNAVCINTPGSFACECEDGYTAWADEDFDGDGVPNSEDAFPNDPSEWSDTDCDGAGDNSDPLPEDPACSGSTTELCNGVDDDCDGIVDEVEGDSPCAHGCNPDTDGCIVCGNGALDPGEVCDDGNTEPGDGCSPTCLTSSAGGEHKVLVVAYINYYGYLQWGQELANRVAESGADVTYYLNPVDGTVKAELEANDYDQLWFYDLESTGKNWPIDVQAIADYHFQLQVKNIILDGRITGDLWHPPASKPVIENYYTNLRERGGGAVYLTDHNAYCNYMFNHVMLAIGYEHCFGSFYGALPFDQENILMKYPNQITYLYNDSSTGAVPYGEQPNGEILYSLAWYGGNSDTPAITTTIEGEIGFHVDISSPAPLYQIFPGESIDFGASATGGTAPITYIWESDLDGEFVQGNPATGSLATPGVHEITLYAVDNVGRVDTDVVLVTVLDPDSDGDGIDGLGDNCPFVANPDQADTDGDGLGDACDFDADGDGICNGFDPDYPGSQLADCTDIDECAEGTDNCDINAYCTNTDGGFDCTCNEGYDGDGVTCAATCVITGCDDLNPCTVDVCDAATGCVYSQVPDSDGDGACDAVDNCPNDAGKTEPGICGCGVSDVDSDGDGTVDCNDDCPQDGNKTEPGICGCGISDADSDGDGTADCDDNCVEVPNSGQEDGDGEAVPCWVKVCNGYNFTGSCQTLTEGVWDYPALNSIVGNDRARSVVVGPGATVELWQHYTPYNGQSSTGAHATFTADDANLDDNGIYGVSSAMVSCDGTTGEGDGVGDACDNCPDDYNTDQADTDGDGAGDACDGCPDDADKLEPGICGCGTADTDSDGDGTADCNDGCPDDPAKSEPGICGCGVADTDSDNDGTADCNDDCPQDANKVEPGICGCGVADTDSDNDGTADCNDDCPNDPFKTAEGVCGCGLSDDCLFDGTCLAEGQAVCATDSSTASCTNRLLVQADCGVDYCNDSGNASGGGGCEATDYFCEGGICGATATSGEDTCGGTAEAPTVTYYTCTNGNTCVANESGGSDSCFDTGDEFGGGGCQAIDFACEGGVLASTETSGTDTCGGAPDSPAVSYFSCSGGNTCVEDSTEAQDDCVDSGDAFGGGSCTASNWVCDGTNTFFVEQDDMKVPLLALHGQETVAEFYSYGYPMAASSNAGEETSNRGNIYLYYDDINSKFSLVVVLDKFEDGSGGDVHMTIDGLDGAEAVIAVKDDPGDYYNLATGQFKWHWLDCCTDGMALTLGGNSACLTFNPTYVSGINEWAVVSHNPDGTRTETIMPGSVTDPFTVCTTSSLHEKVSSGTDTCGGTAEAPEVNYYTCGTSDGTVADRCVAAVTAKQDQCSDSGNEFGGGSCSATDWSCEDGVLDSSETNGTDTCGGTEDAPSVGYFVCQDNNACVVEETIETDICTDDGTGYGGGSCSATDWDCADGVLASTSNNGTDTCGGTEDAPTVNFWVCNAGDGTAADVCVVDTTAEFDACSDDGDGFGGGSCSATDWTCEDGVLTSNSTEGADTCGEAEGDPLALGPVAFWRLGETSGTGAYDATGNGHDGIYVGPVELGADGVATDGDTAMGVHGNAAWMQANHVPIKRSFTALVWVRSNTSVWNTHGWAWSARTPNGFIIHPDHGTRTMGLYVINKYAGTGYTRVGSIHMADITGWHQYGVMYDGESQAASVILDGEIVSTVFYAAGNRDAEGHIDLTIGKDQCCGGTRWGNGALDEALLFDRALDVGELALVYTGKADEGTSAVTYFVCQDNNACVAQETVESDECTDSGNGYGGGSCSAIDWTCGNGVLSSSVSSGTDTCGGTDDVPSIDYWICQDSKLCVPQETVEYDTCTDSGDAYGGGGCLATDWDCADGVLASTSNDGTDTCGGTEDAPNVEYWVCSAGDGNVADICTTGLTEKADTCADSGGNLGGGTCGATDWYCTDGVLASSDTSGTDECTGDADAPGVIYYSCDAIDGDANDVCVALGTVTADECSDYGDAFGGGACSAIDWTCNAGLLASAATDGTDTCGGDVDNPNVTFFTCQAGDGNVADACVADLTGQSDACTDGGNEFGGGSCSAIDWDCESGILASTDNAGTDTCGGTEDAPNVEYWTCSASDGAANDLCVPDLTARADLCTDGGNEFGGGSCSAIDWDCAGGVLASTDNAGTDTCGGDVDSPDVEYWVCNASDGDIADLCVSDVTARQDACTDGGSELGGSSCSATDWACTDGVLAFFDSAGTDTCGGSEDAPNVTYFVCEAGDGAANDSCVSALTEKTDLCVDSGDTYGGGSCAADDWDCNSGLLALAQTAGTDTCGGDEDNPNVTYWVCGAGDGTVNDQCDSGLTEEADACSDSGDMWGGGACSATDWDCAGGVLAKEDTAGTDVCGGDVDAPNVTFYSCNATDGLAIDKCLSEVTQREDICVDTGTPSGGGTCGATDWICQDAVLSSTSSEGIDTCGDGSDNQTYYYVCDAADGGLDDLCVQIPDETPPEVGVVLAEQAVLDDGLIVYQVYCDVYDVCDDNPEYSSLIETPSPEGLSQKLKGHNNTTIKFNLNNNKLDIFAPIPEGVLAELVDLGGIPIEEGQSVTIKTHAGETYHYMYKVQEGIALIELKGPWVRLWCSAIDDAGHDASAYWEEVFHKNDDCGCRCQCDCPANGECDCNCVCENAGCNCECSGEGDCACNNPNAPEDPPEDPEDPPCEGDACNQGVGNGDEDCDPGNSNQGDPDNSNDENGGTPGDPGKSNGKGKKK